MEIRLHCSCILITVGLLALMPVGLTAQPRCATTALQMGAHLLSTPNVTLHKWSDAQTYESGCYIVVDTFTNRGVVVAADERMIPILAEIDNLPTYGESMPPALCELIGQYAREYDALQNGMVEETTSNKPLTSLPDVKPILQTTWGQDSPYNNDCPLSCPSGCVATAMAQIMYHYRYPSHGNGTHSYRSRSRQITQSMDFDATYFDWGKMLPTYGRSGNNAQRQAVATLMHACGVSVNMDYDTNGSGAYDFDIPYALINFFSYNPNTECVLRDYYTTDEWHHRLADELTAGRPVIYCGQDQLNNGGHAFVVDGCRSSDSKVHVNWGWDGQFDGYFVLSSLNPDNYRFSTNQSMVAQFCPEEKGTHEDVAYADRFTVSGTLIGGGIVQASIHGLSICAASTSISISSARFNGYIGLGVWDSEKQFLGTLYEQEAVDWSVLDERKIDLRCSLRMQGLTDGTYYLAPYVRAVNVNIPTRIRTLHAQTDLVAFTVNNDEVIPDEPEPTTDPDGIIWQEGFEDGNLPATLAENSIQGTSEWEVVQVLFSQSSIMPEAASGRGYAALRNRGLGISGKRVVSRLITDDINLTANKCNQIKVKIRKHSTAPDSNDAIALYAYTQDNGWLVLKEESVLNTSVWETVVANLPEGMDRCRIAVEGSLGIGSILFLDDLCVSSNTTTSIKAPELVKPHLQHGSTYDLTGKTQFPHRFHGIYIINGAKVAVK